MAKLKGGQRVRIINSVNNPSHVGCEATVICPIGYGYVIRIDGIPSNHYSGEWMALESNLAPLVNPDEEAWTAFKKLHLTPDPALILAKETVKC